MSTKEEPGPFDGLEAAEPGEPVFTLRAHDPLAARGVRLWCWMKRKIVLRDRSLTDEERAGKLIKIREAEKIAENMEEWRTGQADLVVPEAKEERYSGHTSSPEEIEAKRRFDIIKHAAERLHNAVAEVADAARALEELDAERYCSPAERLLSLSDDLKDLAMDIQPKRASYAARVAAGERVE
jgi:hypothetical protein